MKKLMIYLLMSLIFIAIGSACDANTDKENEVVKERMPREKETTNEKKPEKLIVWEEENKGEALKPILKEFEKEYGIKVEYKEQKVNDGMYTQLRRNGPIGTSPDIVTLTHEKIGQLVEEGLIQEIKVNDEVTDAFLEASIFAEMYQGKLFGLPKSAVTSVLVYNEKMMPKVPDTMNELYKKAKKASAGKEYGFAAEWNDFYDAYGIMTGMGGYVFDRDKKKINPLDIGLNNEGAVKGAQFIQKWYKASAIPEGDKEDMEKMFREGKVASIMSSKTAWMDGKNVGVAPMPQLPNGKPMKTIMEIQGWHITAFTKYPYWSTKFVEYVSNEKNAVLRFERTGEISPIKTIKGHEAIKDSERAQAIAIQLQYAEPIPNIPEMNKVWGPMNSAMQDITAIKAKPKAALDEAVKKIEKSYQEE
ncbi:MULTISPECIES: extracellular solute-binding protein [unclassified Peribacillus]|uniref:extracellular solute-binding protein n=1 Tax=unclassified Peribacillus TaxID=2675266 RepID=UPI003829594E